MLIELRHTRLQTLRKQKISHPTPSPTQLPPHPQSHATPHSLTPCAGAVWQYKPWLASHLQSGRTGVPEPSEDRAVMSVRLVRKPGTPGTGPLPSLSPSACTNQLHRRARTTSSLTRLQLQLSPFPFSASSQSSTMGGNVAILFARCFCCLLFVCCYFLVGKGGRKKRV